MRFGFATPWMTFRLRLPALPRQFSFATLLLLVALAAALLAWLRDHLELQAEIARLRGAQMSREKQQANWGVEQLLGAPDTTRHGDIVTAWASASQDGQQEWILVDFAEAVNPAAIEVHETYNPGALTRASIFDPIGREVTVWQGTDPTQPPASGGVSKLPVHTIWKTRQVKIYLDSPAVPGWNEIDTIGLVDAQGKTHWPINATASSAYGGREANANRSLGSGAIRMSTVEPLILYE
jgi:hypothetical protein